MSFLGNNAGRLIVMPGQISPAAVSYANLDSSVTPSATVGRNRIINGDARISQRATAVYTSGNSGYGGPDRWLVNSIGSGATIQQQQGSLFVNGVAVDDVAQIATVATTGLTSTNFLGGLMQKIEGVNCYDMLGKPATLSFWFYATVVGQYTVSLRDSSTSQSCVIPFTVATASTPQYVSVTFPTLPTTLSVPCTTGVGLILNIAPLNNGTYQTSTTGSWVAGNYVTTPGNVNWAGTINNIIAATNIQLEMGSVATQFEFKTISDVLAQCQRYYQTTICPLVGGYNATGAMVYGDFLLPVVMRTFPTAAVSGPTYSNASAYVSNTATAAYYRGQITITSTGYGFGYGGTLTLNAEL